MEKSQLIRVLIVDDSSVIRLLLSEILKTNPAFEVVGVAPDPYVARELIVRHKPHVMVLDIEMPRMDGLTFLDAVMSHYPIRTLIFSNLTERNSSLVLDAFAKGAIDVMTKPAIDIKNGIEQLRKEFISRLIAVSQAKFNVTLPKKQKKDEDNEKKLTQSPLSLEKTTHQILAIAASTGGTEALKTVLSKLPSRIPGTLIVQHMPPFFTKTYAENLSKLCPFEVREAQDGDRILPGVVLLAPGNYHMELYRSGAYYYVQLNQAEHVNGVRPSADVLMKSVAKYAGKNAIGVILTGMGKDGVQGLLAMKEAGAFNIAQNEETSVVFGMPKAAIESQAVQKVCALDEIPQAILAELAQRFIS